MASPADSAAPLEAQRSVLPLAALVACQIGLHACLTGVRVAVPLQALHDGHSAWTVGLLMALFAAFPMLLALHAGRMADRHGYHRPVRIAVALSLCGALAGAASSHLLAIGAAAALCGAGASVGLIAVQRTGGRMARNATERMRIFSWIAVGPSVASLIGPMTAGVLIDHAGFRVAFGGLAVFPLVTLLLSTRVPREQRSAAAAAPHTPAAWDLLREPQLRRLLFVNWVVSASWDAHSFALPVLGHARGFSASAIGAVLATYAVASTAVRLLLPMVAHRVSQHALLIGSLLLAAVSFALYPLLQPVWAIGLCAALLGLALGCVQPAMMSALHHVAPDGRQGEAMAVRTMASHASSMVMPLVFGALGAAIGASTLFWIMAGALSAGSWQARRLPAAAHR